MNALRDGRTTAGIILVILGVLLLGVEWFDVTGGAVLGVIAVLFLAMYASTRHYGLLIPGMIFGGLAVGVGLQESAYDPSGGLVVIGLGAGFIAIYLIDALVQRASRWWPLIPGSILTVVGATQLVEGTAAAETVGRLWPLGLVAAGVIVLFATFLRPTAGRGQPS